MMTPEQVQAQMQPVFDAVKNLPPSEVTQPMQLGTVLYFPQDVLPKTVNWAPCDGAVLNLPASKLNGVKMPQLENIKQEEGNPQVPMILVVELVQLNA